MLIQLNDYLARIGYDGPLRPDLATLTALHRAHLLAIPYENLDIHLGRALTLDEDQISAKLVAKRRGGWCYEMNGVFAWALRQIGFDVTLLAGAVNRATYGDEADGNHLVLLVALDQPYLADVGFGNGFLEPLPLLPGDYRQGKRSFTLSFDDDRWAVQLPLGDGPGYDFTLTPQRLGDFAEQCARQQHSPNSHFVRVTVCHRLTPEGVVSLRGAVLSVAEATGITQHVIAGAEEYGSVLQQQFGLELPEIRTLWPLVWERHERWLHDQAAA